MMNEQDTRETQMVALINETMANQLWPDQDPLGKRIKFPGSERNPQPWRTVVGVVGDVKQYGLDKDEPMQIYLPQAQYPASWLSLVARTTAEPSSLAGVVRTEIRKLDQDLALYNVATMEELLSDSIALRRFSMLLLAIFAAVAMTLAAVGIYGVISYTVTQRTHEIGIRMALGASRRAIFEMVVGRGMALAIAGVVVGLVAAWAVTGVLVSLLYGVSATDTTTFIVIPLALVGVALAACAIPARRATRVDPMDALRYE
jgi:putative ABC transport system permease protein